MIALPSVHSSSVSAGGGPSSTWRQREHLQRISCFARILVGTLGLKLALALFLLALTISSARADGWAMKQAPLMTRWAREINPASPLPEYPRPQLVRSDWLTLNGIWQFQPAGSLTESVPTGKTLASSILVPYPMESAISGIMQYNAYSWYRRTFTVPTGTAWSGKRIILHLDAVNWQSEVFINGKSVGVHKGGYDPFSYDVTAYLNGSGAQELIVRVYSPQDALGIPRGKQTLNPGGIMYTSSSGIWQSVWLEPVAAAGIQNLVIVPDLDNSRLKLTVNTATTSGVTVTAKVLDKGTVVNTTVGNAGAQLLLPVTNPKLWSPSNPFLYDLQIAVSQNGTVVDNVTSYFGMRKIAVATVGSTRQIYLNNQRIFSMGPLDQGFWPDGLYTAPTDDALRFDLQQEKALGFNMVRKHIKVEPQRWYYWADTLGLLVWQDMPSVNTYTFDPKPIDTAQFEAELRAMVQTHWNSPSIVMWTIFNEAQGQDESRTRSLVPAIKALDPSRLVNQASGYDLYGVGDILDDHTYPQPGNPTSSSQATVDGEYGGIDYLVRGHLWDINDGSGGYTTVSSGAALGPLYDTYANSLVSNKLNNGLSGAVYTEITDVETETNGLLTYDRLLKPDATAILKSNAKAITGYYTTPVDLLPTSQAAGQTWKYTTASGTGNTNWYAAGYNDTSWQSGQGGFGTSAPNAVIRTTWNTADIWLRKQFTVGAVSAAVLNNLQVKVYHDEGCEVYLNGVLAASASGFTNGYVLLPLNDAGKAALIANGTNLIAVHCHQASGDQNIDVGLTSTSLVANSVALPTDPAGFWRLDETSGTTANDASGYGNNGTVANPAWTAGGKLGGCLAFNGTNSQVTIGNPLGGNFSVAFWVKTTQTGGTGQWYQGTGLVDGEVAGTANDFGTALCGGKLAFGVGNPDVTLLSATSINDGAWHLCVATRVQATGAMKLYVDGVLEATGTGGTQTLNAPPTLHFGNLQTGGNFFAGSLDEVRLFTRELGDLEVAALYKDGAVPPAAPAGLAATSTGTQTTLSWGGVLWASGYKVKRATASGGPYTTLASVTLPTFSDTGITSGTTYYYVVTALNAAGEGASSSELGVLAGTNVNWYNATALAGLANGAPVANWPDVGGTGYDAYQYNVNQQPVYVSGAINGYPAVRFNGANSNYLRLPRPVQGDFTLMCVFRSTAGIGTDTTYYSGAGLVSGEVPGSANDFGVSINSKGQVLAGTGSPDVTAATGTATNYLDGKPHLLTFKRKASTGAITLYMDGTQVATATGGTQSLTAPAFLTFGCQQTLNNFFTGDLAEIKIFDSALSDSVRSAQENALNGKYGLSLPSAPTGLSATHTSGSAALRWTASPGATSYRVNRTLISGANYTTIATVSGTTYLDGTLSDGRSAYYVVTAVNGAGESPASNVAYMAPAPVASTELAAPTLALSGGMAQVTLPTIQGRTYQLQRSDTLAPDSWVNVGALAGGTGGPVTLSDPAPTSGVSQRFYRVKISP